MHPHNVALLYDPDETLSHETARQAAACLRGETRFVLLPADRHLPGRLEDMDVAAAMNFIQEPEKAIQADSLCGLLEIPVAGNPARTRQLFADQVLLRDFLAFNNLPVPAYYVPRASLDNLASDHRNFGYPVRILPRFGRHPGVSARCFEDLLAGVLSFRGLPGGVLIERSFTGKRIQVAVWRQKALGSARIDPCTDCPDSPMEGMLIPPDMAPFRVRNLERVAVRLACLLQIHHPLLITMAQDDSTGSQLADIDLCPSLTRHAPFCRIAGAFGVSQKDLFAGMLGELAINRFSLNTAKSSWTCG